MIDHAERAKALFLEGYNCAQAVFCAFTDVTGLDMTTAARLSSSFGGGLGRLREVCGAVSAASMVLGLVMAAAAICAELVIRLRIASREKAGTDSAK